MCNMSAENLTTYFFCLCSQQEEREIKKHVIQCQDCQTFLASLERANNSLNGWFDEKPHPETLDIILQGITQSYESTPQKNNISLLPVLAITFSIFAILAAIFIFKDHIIMLPFFADLSNTWLGQLLGSFGVVVISVGFLGILASIAFAPILILEARSKKFKYYFN